MTAKIKSGRSLLNKVGWALMGLLGLLYLFNPGAGVFELIPDNIPFVGNLDEATAAYLVLAALKILFDLDLTPGTHKKKGDQTAKSA